MYNITDKAEAVRAVQRFLGLSESGNYTAAVRSSVEKFQGENGISVTGKVDYETFLALRGAYLLRVRINEQISGDSRGKYPYTRSRYGEDVTGINLELRRALGNYTHEYLLPRGAIYDVRSTQAVRRLREIYGMGADETLDEELHARIRREILTPT